MNIVAILTLFLAPVYIIKFNFFGQPANLLMAWVFAVWLIFAIWLSIKKHWLAWWINIKALDKKVLILIALFFISGIISLFVFGINQNKLGQFIVLFLQPLSIFFITRFIIEKHPNLKNLFKSSLYLLLGAMGLFAVIQYFTLTGLPPSYWGNSEEPKRALSFFTHPNFYALFAAPLLALLLPDLKNIILNRRWLYAAAWIVGALGLFFSLSRAGWLGLATAAAVYLIMEGNKNITRVALAAVIVMVIVIISTPTLRYRILLPFYGEKSAVSRLSLWTTGWEGIKKHPVTGLGLTGFAQNWPRLNTDPNLDTHNFPHNIFLNFWVETGLLGLLSLTGLLGLVIWRGLRSTDPIKLGAALFLITFLVQGLLDNPYFKNDLAMVFWIILSLAI